MANIPYIAQLNAPTRRREQAVGGTLFTWSMIVLLAWFLGGLFLDGWAHSHGKVDQSFFTPWHAVFYSGFAAVTIGIGSTMLYNRTQGYAWHRAIPAGYELALTGLIVFAFGGISDMIWHILFGIERGIEALLSPSHLLLVLGLVLTLSSPLRAAWQRPNTTPQPSFLDLLPMLLSLAFTLSVLSFITAYLHPFVDLWPASWNRGDQTLGVGAIILQSGLLMGFVLLAMRRWHLPFGSLTLVFTFNALAMSVLDDHYFTVGVAAVSGLIADGLIRVLKPSSTRTAALRLFAFAVPAVLFCCYLLALKATVGLTWSFHMLTGAPVLGGATGLLLSYLSIPPEIPEA